MNLHDVAPGSTAPDPERWKVLAVLLVSVVMTLVGVSIVNVALPSIRLGLGASQSQLQWILSGYALTFGVFLVPAGRAGDLFGRTHLFIGGVALFAAASLAAGCAPNPETLIAARIVQGIASGILNPQAIGMIQDHFRGQERARAFGLYGSSVGVSLATGPLIGGLLIHAAGIEDGWRWTFLINIPVALLTCLLGFRWLPRRRRPTRTSRRPRWPGGARLTPRRDLDPVGTVLLAAAIVGILVPFIEAGAAVSAAVWALLPVGLLLSAGWVWWERSYARRGRQPMVDLSLMRIRSFTGGLTLISLYFLGVTSIWILIALYLQDGLGHTALATGAVGLPNAALAAVAATWGGRRVMASGGRVVVLGLCIVLLGIASTILVVRLHAQTGMSEWWLLVTLGLIGAGQGAVVSPNQTLSLHDVPAADAGLAGGVLQTGQRVGMSIGIAMITALTFSVLSHHDWELAVSVGMAAIGLIVLLALLIALRDTKPPRHRTDNI